MLFTYKNLYASFITFTSGKGNEVVMELNRKQGVYSVCRLNNWSTTYHDYFTCPVQVKQAFRQQVDQLKK